MQHGEGNSVQFFYFLTCVSIHLLYLRVAENEGTVCIIIPCLLYYYLLYLLSNRIILSLRLPSGIDNTSAK